MAKTTFFSFINELKDKNDIVDVIGEIIDLKQKGRNYWACCPFHGEKEPSFAINPEGQYYKCFGCQESGDVINFIEKYKGMEFMEAVKFLAARVHMEVPSFDNDNSNGIKQEEKKRLYDLMKYTARFYNSNLSQDKALQFNEYLEKRGLNKNIVTKFGLGASLSFNELYKFLKSKGFTDEEMLKAGVVARSDKNPKECYDFLANRLIFPILNYMNEVIAFGGRSLQTGNFAKYKNTAQTVLFDKSKNLYGINVIKNNKIKDNINSLIVVEGYMDVVSLNQAGITNVVASMGTALTKEQARLIKRYVENVYISYDGDFAGQKATMRGLDILSEEGLIVKVVSMPEGLDPDEVIKNYGVDRYKQCLLDAKPLVLYKLDNLLKEYSLDNIDEKKKYVLSALNIISKLKTFSEREEYLKIVSKNTTISLTALKEDLSQIMKGNKIKQTYIEEEPKNETLSSKVREAIELVLTSKVYEKEYVKDINAFTDFIKVDDIYMLIYNFIVERESLGKTFNDFIDSLEEDLGKAVEKLLTTNMNILKTSGDMEEEYYNSCYNTLQKEKNEREYSLLQRNYLTEDDESVKATIAKRMIEIKKQFKK